ncbi:helix-turn-helix domain-containing protein [Paenibacillus hemerocallicola]|uniref:Helix-turn-helix domain-containing protein n=1 Tax=Paenibacillus hemerocallicola TaxID=1172614 RepID=A0A5C4T035_9BACL|nr:helix-turn-helix domain-containing protein [Paenibacillus hemerocallicola]TNJ62468.1 helix-turn-helix domain-containing protein [Paenibacillus hemerocallicola]
MSRERFDLLTLQEAMDILGVSRATIDRWRKEKQLPYIKIGKEVWVNKQKLHDWVQLHALKEPEEKGPRETADRRTVTVGYQSGAALLWSTLIMKQLGLFEQELERISPATEYEVRWTNASNGMELVEELISGRAQIVSVGDYPISASRELGLLLPRFRPLMLAFDGKTRSGGGISLVVPPGSRVRKPEELAEVSISTVGHSSASYRLKEYMGVFGFDSAPITHRSMGDCLSGLVEGSTGAAVLWEPYLSWAQLLGAGAPIVSAGIGEDYLTGLMTDGNWAEGNEDIVIAYLKAHLRAHAFIRRQPERAAVLVHQASGFPVSVISLVLPQIRWDASFYSRDLQTLNRVSGRRERELQGGTAVGTGVAFQKRYLQEAAEALKLPILPDAPLPGEWSQEQIY